MRGVKHYCGCGYEMASPNTEQLLQLLREARKRGSAVHVVACSCFDPDVQELAEWRALASRLDAVLGEET